MKIAFYSDDSVDESRTFDISVVNLLGNNNARIAYIPSRSDKDMKYFHRTKEHYRKYGLKNFFYFDIDEEFDSNLIPELINSDVIYLSGGNTLYFLYNIRKRGMEIVLKNFAQTPGKVLIGVSAGSMIMTPSIKNTVIYHQLLGNLDQINKVGLEDFNGLNLVDFEFIPHYSEEKKGEMVRAYLNQTNNTVYGCPDGAGIIVNNSKVLLHGNVVKLK